MMYGIFPDESNFEKEDIEKQNLQIKAYGRRIKKDQTFYEYLIEFLLVFIGEDKSKVGLEKITDYNKQVKYKVNTNIALKRFIFMKNSKKDNRFELDEEANEILEKMLCDKIEADSISKEEVIEVIRELYNGFTAFSGDRGWFAKAFLPMCEETIFPEAMGKKSDRKNLSKENDDIKNLKVDTMFQFKEHNFMARGGEVYFVHLLQGLNKIEKSNSNESKNIQKELDKRMKSLINSFPEFKILSQWIQENWIDNLVLESGKDRKDIYNALTSEGKCRWVSDNYKRRSELTVYELLNILRVDINEFDKFEILSLGIIMQILRMMSESATCIASNNKEYNTPWIINVNSNTADKRIKKIASEHYKEVEEKMIIAIAKMLEISDVKSELSALKSGNDDSHKLLRKLGKDIGLIVPIKGENMRFSLNDNIIKFLVIALVESGRKITLDTFLSKMYKNFGIIIGPNEYEAYLNDKNLYGDPSVLQYNIEEFQQLLRKNGFLKELSDATSIVINPYKKLEV